MKQGRARRQIFVLTSEEKGVVVFVCTMLLLGVVALRYRTAHPPPARALTYMEQKAASARARREAHQRRARTPAPAAVNAGDEE